MHIVNRCYVPACGAKSPLHTRINTASCERNINPHGRKSNNIWCLSPVSESLMADKFDEYGYTFIAPRWAAALSIFTPHFPNNCKNTYSLNLQHDDHVIKAHFYLVIPPFFSHLIHRNNALVSHRMYCKDLKLPDKNQNNTEFLMEFNDYIDTKTPNNPMCECHETGKCSLKYFSLPYVLPRPLTNAFIVWIQSSYFSLPPHTVFHQRAAKLYSVCCRMYISERISAIWLDVKVCIEHLTEERQREEKKKKTYSQRSLFPVKHKSGSMVWCAWPGKALWCRTPVFVLPIWC